ncbi:membrane progestin receptor gamma-like [Dreissena polymorpha]|uniref:Uncharacterized protein n=1 Tax=Dreissena polymorpha TaxID=45954 RepID=A0A9D3YN17_DREPO|nr:membrane progestin receptor gamma-like [Dreissena polymorpha]XP_052252723.1 membrane progestin receptor gamma-like [Dreissena polymorpha]XP_052252724.1 membrane progestin receptor gamma-like [Dreissena polymorpha]XP_052252725.1 membrane progestin receptor gamma-like [Dreissena polymorpha]XP_052252726.1 membrane progestin receptor gamma-like [Dreissena polymorpha]KAH3701098.1 hypothetical protein DPMN_076082 [Dreissena polymorpha]
MFVAGATGLGGPLYHREQMPEDFHESFIDKGYRSPKSSPFQCVLSVFDTTNETLNFWTHFLPSWYFMWVIRDLSDTLDFRHDSFTWPLLAYLCMCCIYPLASSVAHTFNTMSDNARHICFFLDYSAISASAFAVAIAYRAYSFPDELRFTFPGDWFVPAAFINSLFCILVSCKTRLMPHSITRKIMRISALGWPCVFSTFPLTYRLLSGTLCEMTLTSTYYHAVSILMMYVAGFLYGTHFPERLFPGRFDIIGHSHQLFHMCTILGTMNQIQAILYDMKEKKRDLIENWEFKSASTSIGLVGFILMVNTVIVAVYSVILYTKKTKSA